MPIDLAILKFFNVTIAVPVLDIFFSGICDFDIWRWPLALVAVALLWKGGPKGRWMVLLAIITALIVDPSIYRIFKPLFGRLRPCHDTALGWVLIIDGCGGRYGFPSSHAANMFGLAVIFGAFYKTTRYYMYPLAAFVAIGRVYLGVHYPSDVLAGAFYGAAVGFVVILVFKRIRPTDAIKYLVKQEPMPGETDQNQ
ncbi:MAG: phosphatase PAP2 family protein [candidate division Zixibacteria bacterium]